MVGLLEKESVNVGTGADDGPWLEVDKTNSQCNGIFRLQYSFYLFIIRKREINHQNTFLVKLY